MISVQNQQWKIENVKAISRKYYNNIENVTWSKVGRYFQISKSKLKHYRKTCNTDISYQIENSFKPFWNNVLIPRLQEKHNTKPVHTLEEIESLAIKFPENIKQF